MKAKNEYNMLLRNGILLELYPDELTGDWETDKEYFIKIYEANLFFTEHLDIEYDEI